MKKVLIGLIGVVILGGFFFIITNKRETQMQDKVLVEENAAVSTETLGIDKNKPSVNELIAQGGAHMCTVTQKIDSAYAADMKGVVYMSEGKVRGEFDTQVQNITMKTSLIARDGYSYTWTSLSNEGVKVKEIDAVDTSGPTGTVGQFRFNDEAIGAYECTTWVTDESKFTLPTSIIFKEA